MRLRTFTAPDMPAAMEMVRDALGDEAIILKSEPHLNGVKSVRVVAAADISSTLERGGREGSGQRNTVRAPTLALPLKGEGDNLRFEIQNLLRFHNLPELFVAKLMQQASDSALSSLIAMHRISGECGHLLPLALGKLMGDYFQFEPLPLNTTATRIMLVGPPGAGKTLTIARLTARIVMNGQKPAVITADNKRAGGIEQLQSFTDILGIDLKVAPSPAELAKRLATIPKGMPLLIDTAGCNPYDKAEMHELQAYAECGAEPVLTLAAGGDSLEAIDIAEAFAELPVRRLLVTRADTARRLGGVLAAAAAHQFAFCNVSQSSSVADALKTMDGGLLAKMLMRYQL